MLRILSPVSLSLVILTQSVGYSAGVIRHDRDGKEYDKLGQSAEFQSTCVYLSDFRRSQNKGCAVLISSRWAVTAAHVISRTGDVSTRDHRLIVGG